MKPVSRLLMFRALLCPCLCLAHFSQLPAQQKGAWRQDVVPFQDVKNRYDSVDRIVKVWDSYPDLKLDYRWDGPVNSEGFAHGEGELNWRKGGSEDYRSEGMESTYKGWMKLGKKEGFGVLKLESGAQYAGDWKDNMRNGTGKYFYANGEYYEGEFSSDKIHGHGVLTSPDSEMYEGTFADDKRHGSGRLTLPGVQSYVSEWVQGVESPDSRAKRIALLGGENSAAATLRLAVFINNVRNKKNEYIGYRSRVWRGNIIIEPDFPEWSTWVMGGVVHDYWEAGASAACLDARLQNNSRRPVTVTGGYIDVASSVPDYQPFIHTTGYAYDHVMSLGLSNFGWGKAINCVMEFNLDNTDSAAKPEKFEFRRELGVLDHTLTVDLATEFSKCGVDVKTLKGVGAGQITAKDPRKILGRFARFDSDGKWLNSDAQLKGNLSYMWKDASGAQRTQKSEIASVIELDPRVEKGAGGPEDAKYDLLLQSNKAGYRVPFSFKKEILPGSNARVELNLAAPKGSLHQLRVVLLCSDGAVITSIPCQWRYFTPSYGSKSDEK